GGAGAGGRLARAEPVGRAAAAAIRAGAGARRPRLRAPPPGRRRPRHGRGGAAGRGRACQRRRPRRRQPPAGRPPRWPHPPPGARARGGRRPPPRRGRRRARAAPRARADAEGPGGGRRPCPRRAVTARAALHDRDLRRAVRVGHRERAAPGRGRRVTASTDPVPDVAADDRVQPLDSPLAFARRRLDGRFQIDAFGGDAQLMDLAGRALALGVRVDVEHAERIPRLGGALVVANRGLGLFEPAALAVAVRQTVGRRLRVIGAPDLPVLGDVLRKIGAVGYRPDDVAVLVRAGHLAAAPLAPTWLRSGAGAPPRELLAAIVGFPVVPARRRPRGPA